MSRATVLGALGGLLLGALLTAATFARAQVVQTSTVSAAPSPAPTATAPVGLAALPPDTVVSIKDHGESQTVMVYMVDDKGMARLTHKARFFY
jgi:hypothetical protein